jgi:hypothetical protein
MALQAIQRCLFDSHDPATSMEGHRPRCPCRARDIRFMKHLYLRPARPPALQAFQRRLYDSHDPATIMEGHRPRCPCCTRDVCTIRTILRRSWRGTGLGARVGTRDITGMKYSYL